MMPIPENDADTAAVTKEGIKQLYNRVKLIAAHRLLTDVHRLITGSGADAAEAARADD